MYNRQSHWGIFQNAPWKFLNYKKLISKYHHGGQREHSTVTCITNILHRCGKQYENNDIVTILITDLSKAYDTVDHLILL